MLKQAKVLNQDLWGGGIKKYHNLLFIVNIDLK